MKANETTSQETGLQFFGKLSAAVSHDLKNVLSIINEKAGLLEDFCHMTRQGMALDMERIDAVTAQVKAQVERADQIIRCFNRFAHSTDHPIASVDMGETVTTLVRLAQRLLAGMEVSVEVQPIDPPVVITTRPLMVQELIWAAMQWMAAQPGEKGAMSLAVERCGDGARVLIGALGHPPEGGLDAAFCAATDAVREALQAEIRLDHASGMLQLQLAALEPPP